MIGVSKKKKNEKKIGNIVVRTTLFFFSFLQCRFYGLEAIEKDCFNDDLWRK